MRLREGLKIAIFRFAYLPLRLCLLLKNHPEFGLETICFTNFTIFTHLIDPFPLMRRLHRLGFGQRLPSLSFERFSGCIGIPFDLIAELLEPSKSLLAAETPHRFHLDRVAYELLLYIEKMHFNG